MPTANPDADFKEILPGSPTAVREFPSGDQLALAVDVYDNKVRRRTGSNIRTIVTADDGAVVFSVERRAQVRGAEGRQRHLRPRRRRFRSRAWRPGRYVLRVEAKSLLSKRRHRVARGRVHRTLMGDVETLARGEDSRLVEPRRFLIRDRQAFAAVWAAHAGPNAVGARSSISTRAWSRPSSRASGRRRVTRSKSRARAAAKAAALVIVVDERQPDPSQVAAQVIVSPFHVVHAATRRRRGDGSTCPIRAVSTRLSSRPHRPRVRRAASPRSRQSHVAAAA